MNRDGIQAGWGREIDTAIGCRIRNPVSRTLGRMRLGLHIPDTNWQGGAPRLRRAANRAARRSASTTVAKPPLHVRLFSPVLMALVRAGVPLGYNRLLTVRGRSTGEPRTVAVAVLPIAGRRWVWAPWGDSHWVKNLRAAGRATIREGSRTLDVIANELEPPRRIEFFRNVLRPFAAGIPFGVAFIRVMDGVDLNHPVEAAARSRVFELRPA